MTGASVVSSLVFLTVVALIAGGVVFAILKAGGGPGQHDRPAAVRAATLLLAFWLAGPALLTLAGLTDRYSPPVALLPVAAATAATLVLALSPIGARLATAIPLAALVGFQVFRVAVEWWLHRMYLEGAIPVQMTWSGRNFDVVSGITGALLGLWLATGRPSRPLVLSWNLLGLALLANIVTVAILSAPVPFRVFTNDPPNLVPSTFPWVWLPTVLVQAALLGHLLVFRALRAAPAAVGGSQTVRNL